LLVSWFRWSLPSPCWVLLAIPQAAGAPPSFGPATSFAVGVSPKSVAAGDLDRDGDLDLARANQLSNDVSVLLSGVGPQHFKCYEVGSEQPDFSGEDVRLTDQFGTEVVHVGDARMLLTPVGSAARPGSRSRSCGRTST